MGCRVLSYVPRTGLEPACLAALAPETSVSTISPPGPVAYLLKCRAKLIIYFKIQKLFYFLKVSLPEFFNHTHQILAVLVLYHRLRNLLKPLGGNPSFTECNPL